MELLRRIREVVDYGFEAADTSVLREQVDIAVARIAETGPALGTSSRSIDVREVATGEQPKDRAVKEAAIKLGPPKEWKGHQSHFLNNCQLISIASALARVDPKAIQGMVKEVTQEYFSTLPGGMSRSEPYHGTKMGKVTFVDEVPVLVTPRLDYIDTTYKLLKFGSVHGAPKNALWLPLIEKAYAVLRGNRNYLGLDLDNPDAPDIIQNCYDLWGRVNIIQSKSDSIKTGSNIYTGNADASGTGAAEDYDVSVLEGMLKRASRRPTVITTPSFAGPTAPVTNDYYPMHTYVVLSLRGGRVSLWEPLHQETPKIKLKDLFLVFDGVYQRA